MAAFGNVPPPAVPVGRNWKSIGLAVSAGALATAGFVWLALDSADKPHGKRDERSGISYAGAELAAREFTTGYKRDEPPAQPAPAAPAPIVPAPAVHIQTKPEPVKPMRSMFAMTADTTADFPERDRLRENSAPFQQTGEYRPGTSDGIDKLESEQRQGLSAQKNRWLANAGTGGDDVVSAPFRPPVSRFMLQAGTIIRATTLNAVNSDLPGDVAAVITDDIRDTPTGNFVLIPAGSKLYGRYNDQLAYGQRRAQIGWTRLLFPDGSSQNIGSMAGTDASGAAGIEGDVDRHVGGMAGAIAGAAFFTVLGQAGNLLRGDGGDTNIGVVGAGAAGSEAQGIGRQFMTRELNRPNTLSLPQGSEVAVMLSKDVALPPYRADQ